MLAGLKVVVVVVPDRSVGSTKFAPIGKFKQDRKSTKVRL